jgi:ppGpp synthetase/RelA/SpoT-type nucleotidyltranferase
MAHILSKTQIDKLGDRLRKADSTEADLRMLDEYRLSFGDVYEAIVGAIRNELGLEPTGRPAKSTSSITEKLLRESIRLSQLQDIAGCRIVVPGIADQDRVVEALRSLFDNVSVADRRSRPSNGYRAVHVIVSRDGKLIEIQVRTWMQHGWAELSEKASDVIDPAIKYGSGNKTAVEALLGTSELLAAQESKEAKFAELEARAAHITSLEESGVDEQEKLAELKEMMDDWKKREKTKRDEIMTALQDMLEDLSQQEIDDAVSD